MISCYFVFCALSAPQFGTPISSAHSLMALTARDTGFRVFLLMGELLTGKLLGVARRQRSFRPCRRLLAAGD